MEYNSLWVGLELTTLVVIGTDCIGSCKTNYHTTTFMTMTAPGTKIICIWYIFPVSNMTIIGHIKYGDTINILIHLFSWHAMVLCL